MTSCVWFVWERRPIYVYQGHFTPFVNTTFSWAAIISITTTTTTAATFLQSNKPLLSILDIKNKRKLFLIPAIFFSLLWHKLRSHENKCSFVAGICFSWAVIINTSSVVNIISTSIIQILPVACYFLYSRVP